MKRLILAVAFLATPFTAWAQDACEHEAPVTCAEGTTLDQETGECIPIVS